MVYQEQVMEAAKIIAGYTLGGADMLRRAMGKKDAEAMAEERGQVRRRGEGLHGIDEKTSDAIFDILNKFAGYGFNKSHSAAYALLSYQTGFLKANHPVQFMAAMLSSELGNSDKVAHFVAECEAMGLVVLGPDVNESREMFTPVRRHPLRPGGIKGVGELAAQRIIAEREANGPFAGLRRLRRAGRRPRGQQAGARAPGEDRGLRLQRREPAAPLRGDRRRDGRQLRAGPRQGRRPGHLPRDARGPGPGESSGSAASRATS
jgi:DNA polymerase III alpha subunit